jgi:hypothetical protein
MLSQDVIAFLRSRPIAMLCTRDANNRPYGHESCLPRVEADHVVVLVPEQLARNLVENVRDNGVAALLVSRAPGDHRSVQIKGRITDIEMPAVRKEMFDTLERLIETYRGYMPDDEARQMWTRMSQQPMYRLHLQVAEVFDQTPGPGAGRRIAGGPA